eukprot:TRINITY_DN2190_c0_g1_i4.p1 TRINITY_DN2190_c0_g1~~TRINITY_DN2190_c0_g1_i4.p1  ORF type:complete len:312 (+),score=59.26 TRINITY_DN2190_c0_g1_i4:46-981(+)
MPSGQHVGVVGGVLLICGLLWHRSHSAVRLLDCSLPTPAPTHKPPPAPRSAQSRPPCHPHVQNCTGPCARALDFMRSQRNPKDARTLHAAIAHCACTSEAKVAVEVGVRFGDTTSALLRLCPTLEEVHSVDPFMPNYDKADVTSVVYSDLRKGFGLAKDEEFAKVWGDALSYDNRMHGCRWRQIRGFSPAEAAGFPDESVDFVYLDGLHTYEGLRDDILGWYPKVKKGGVVMFDDYQPDGDAPFPGVTKAVQQFLHNESLVLDSLVGKVVWVKKPLAPGQVDNRTLACAMTLRQPNRVRMKLRLSPGRARR